MLSLAGCGVAAIGAYVKTYDLDEQASPTPAPSSTPARSSRSVDDVDSYALDDNRRVPEAGDYAWGLVLALLSATAGLLLNHVTYLSLITIKFIPVGAIAVGAVCGAGPALLCRHRRLVITWGIWGLSGAVTAVSFMATVVWQWQAAVDDGSDEGLLSFAFAGMNGAATLFFLVCFTGGSLFVMLKWGRRNPYEDLA